MTIAYRHLREPLRHSVKCGHRCVKGCPVDALEQALSEPVLASESEIADAQQEEDRFLALAAEARGSR